MRRVIAAFCALLGMSVAVAVIAAAGRRWCWLSRLSTGSASEPSTTAALADTAAFVSLALAQTAWAAIAVLWIFLGMCVALAVLAAVTARTTTLCAAASIDRGASVTTASHHASHHASHAAAASAASYSKRIREQEARDRGAAGRDRRGQRVHVARG